MMFAKYGLFNVESQPTAVTTPFWSTVAILESDEDQVKFLFVAFVGLKRTERVLLAPPATISMVSLSNAMDVTGTEEETTVTAQVAE
jgi:hypothetical protein